MYYKVVTVKNYEQKIFYRPYDDKSPNLATLLAAYA